MPRNRINAVQRIVASQKVLRRIERVRLTDLENESRSMADLELILLSMLQVENSGAVVRLYLDRLKSVRQQLDRLSVQADEQSERLLHESSKLKAAEELQAQIAWEQKLLSERKEIQEAVEQFMQNSRASLP